MQKRFWMNKEWKVAEKVANMMKVRYGLELEDWQILKIAQAVKVEMRKNVEEELEFSEEDLEVSEKELEALAWMGLDAYPFLEVERNTEIKIEDEEGIRKRINRCPADCYD